MITPKAWLLAVQQAFIEREYDADFVSAYEVFVTKDGRFMCAVRMLSGAYAHVRFFQGESHKQSLVGATHTRWFTDSISDRLGRELIYHTNLCKEIASSKQ